MSNNNKDKQQDGPSLEDLKLYGHLLKPAAHKEDPEKVAAQDKLGRRQFVSMGLAFSFGIAGFFTAKKADKVGSNAYQAKLEEMGGYEGIAKACLPLPKPSEQHSECHDKAMQPAWDEHHKAARNYQIAAASLFGAGLASFGALAYFFKKSNEIQAELMDTRMKEVKTNFKKIKENAPSFFEDTTPKGPSQ